MKQFVPLFLLFALLTGCKAPNNNNTPRADSAEKDSTLNKTGTTHSASFYQQYEGTIAGKPVVMNLVKNEDRYEMSYYYKNIGKIIHPYQKWEPPLSEDTVYFQETFSNINQEDWSQTDHELNLHITQEAIRGFWFTGDGKKRFEVELNAVELPGSYDFSVVACEDSLVYAKLAKDTPRAHISIMLLEPKDTEDRAWVTSLLLKNYLNTESKKQTGDLLQNIRNYTTAYINDYKTEMDALKGEGFFKHDEESAASFYYEEQMTSNVLYNQKGFVVLKTDFFTYSGGAHGMYTRNISCFDMEQKKLLTLSDVVTIDSVQLQTLVEKYFRQQNDIAPDVALSNILFENQLPANNNFYFTPNGLGFVYQPYEVAAYAYGIIDVWIPYQALHPWLQPQFVKKMQL